MKRTSILIICIFIISSNIYAQEKFNYGLKFGMVSSDFSIKISSDTYVLSEIFGGNRLGPALGFFSDFNLNDAVNFELDLLYLQKGANEEIEITTIQHPEGTGEKVSIDYQLDYLQLNAAIAPKIDFKNIQLQGKVGLSLALLLGTKGFYYFTDTDDFSTGYILGGKIIFKNLLSKPIYIEVLHNIDFGSFYNSDIYEFTNETWMFNLGFYYN